MKSIVVFLGFAASISAIYIANKYWSQPVPIIILAGAIAGLPFLLWSFKIIDKDMALRKEGGNALEAYFASRPDPRSPEANAKFKEGMLLAAQDELDRFVPWIVENFKRGDIPLDKLGLVAEDVEAACLSTARNLFKERGIDAPELDLMKIRATETIERAVKRDTRSSA